MDIRSTQSEPKLVAIHSFLSFLTNTLYFHRQSRLRNNMKLAQFWKTLVQTMFNVKVSELISCSFWEIWSRTVQYSLLIRSIFVCPVPVAFLFSSSLTSYFLSFAVFAEFSFTCVIDLTSALEYDGIMSGFMKFYQKTVGFLLNISPYDTKKTLFVWKSKQRLVKAGKVLVRIVQPKPLNTRIKTQTFMLTQHLLSALYTVQYVFMWCASGRALSGNSLCHHDVLLGWNSTLCHVPGDDQQDNREVGEGEVSSSYVKLVFLKCLFGMTAKTTDNTLSSWPTMWM